MTTPTDAPIVNRAHFGNVDIQTGSISFSGVASLTIRVQIFLAKPYVRTYSPRTSFKTMALFSVQGGLLDDMKNSKVFSRWFYHKVQAVLQETLIMYIRVNFSKSGPLKSQSNKSLDFGPYLLLPYLGYGICKYTTVMLQWYPYWNVSLNNSIYVTT